MDKGIDKLSDMLNEDAVYKWPGATWKTMEHKSPINSCWLIVDGETIGLATDCWFSIEYADAYEMKQQFIEFISNAISPDVFNLIRTGELRNLSFKLGPDSGSGADLNEDNGIEPVYAKVATK